MPKAARKVPSFVFFEASMESSTFWALFFALPLERGNIADLEAVNIGNGFKRAIIMERLNQFGAQVIDIHKFTRCVMADALGTLSGAQQTAGTTESGLSLRSFDGGLHTGQRSGMTIGFL